MLSNKQRQLIEALRKNSRAKLTDLSKQLEIPMSTVHDRLYKLVQTKTIRLVSLMDYAAMNFPIRAWVFLSTRKKRQAKKFLQEHLHINTLLAVHNGAEFACEAIFRDFCQYDEFLESCKQFGDITYHPVIEVICQETAQVAS